MIPMIYHYDRSEPTQLYLHGAPNSQLQRGTISRESMCVTVTLVDGLVYSCTALYHSVNYRRAVCFGRGVLATDAERQRVLDRIIPRYFPGRMTGKDFDPMPNAHSKATAVVIMTIEDATAKVRRGGPQGPRDRFSRAWNGRRGPAAQRRAPFPR